jgi:predicted secreted protein
VWLVAIALVLLGAADTQAIVPVPKVLKQKDSGRTVRLVAGQELRIRLKVCYSCGFHWETELAPDKAVLKRLKQREENLSDCPPPCVGGAAVTVFRYRAEADGKTKLQLGRIPPGQQPADKVSNGRARSWSSRRLTGGDGAHRPDDGVS